MSERQKTAEKPIQHDDNFAATLQEITPTEDGDKIYILHNNIIAIKPSPCEN